MKSKITTFTVLGYYLKKFLTEKWFFIPIIFIIFTNNLAFYSIPLFFEKIVDLISANAGVPNPELVEEVFLIFWQLSFVFLWFFLGYRFVELLMSNFQPNVGAKINKEVFTYLHKHSYKFFANNFSGALVKKFNRLVDGAETLIDLIVYEFIGLATSFLFVFTVLFLKNKIVGLLFLVWFLIFTTVSILLTKSQIKYTLNYFEKDSLVTAALADTVTNNLNISIFSSLKKEFTHFSERVEDWRKAWKRHWMAYFMIFGVQGFLIIGFQVLSLYLLILYWSQGLVTLGFFVLFQLYLLQISRILFSISGIFRRLYSLISNSTEMLEILHTPHEVQDISGAKELRVQKGEIEFKNVNFAYDSEVVFENLNLKIKPGEKVALVGPSGGGKTSFVQILFRFFDIQSGQILIDGQDISKITQESLRKNISLIPQDPILFHRTLRKNISYACDKCSEKKVLEVSKKARCHSFIQTLSDGYESFVGERGVKLSGGQKQRVAIARALLEDGKIFIFDEATSALDSESEKLIQEAMDEAMKNKTSIVIAHRLSTVMKADRILVLEDGKVLEEGKHDELIKKENGTYKKLWEIQSGGFI